MIIVPRRGLNLCTSVIVPQKDLKTFSLSSDIAEGVLLTKVSITCGSMLPDCD